MAPPARRRPDAARRRGPGRRGPRPARRRLRPARAAAGRLRGQRWRRAVGRGPARRRGARRSRRCSSPTACTTPGSRPCAPPAAGRPGTSTPSTRRPTWWSTASSASAVAPGCARDAVAALAALRRRCPVVAVDVPSGVDVDTGDPRRAARARRPDRHLRHPQGRPPRRPRLPRERCRRTSSTSASTLGPRPPAVEALQPDDVRALLPRPERRRAQVHPRRGRRPRRLGHLPGRRAARRVAARTPGWPGWCATSGRTAIADTRAQRPPRGRRRRPGAGLGRGPRRW